MSDVCIQNAPYSTKNIWGILDTEECLLVNILQLERIIQISDVALERD
jgi:hypothetical protein